MQRQLTELNSWFILLIFTEAFASVAPGSLMLCSLQEAAMNCAQGDSVEVMCSRASDGNVFVGGTVWIHTLKKSYTCDFLSLGSSGMQESFIKIVKSSLVLLWLGSGLYFLRISKEFLNGPDHAYLVGFLSCSMKRPNNFRTGWTK